MLGSVGKAEHWLRRHALWSKFSIQRHATVLLFPSRRGGFNMTFAEWSQFLRHANMTTNLAVGTGLLLLRNAAGLLFWLLAVAQYRW